MESEQHASQFCSVTDHTYAGRSITKSFYTYLYLGYLGLIIITQRSTGTMCIPLEIIFYPVTELQYLNCQK